MSDIEVYRVTGDSPRWQKIAYDYIRLDSFVVGQGIPVELEFGHDGPEDDIHAVILLKEHKPVSGCRIAYHGDPESGYAKIERVATVREQQRTGIGARMIAEAEKWIKENGYHHVLITSQDRSVGFYNAIGYETRSDEVYAQYFPEEAARKKERAAEIAKERAEKKAGPMSFTCVLVEKYL
ncbi:MAG: GNAT family N-acetyltransferase [Oribacterium sp.]|nr:GNAT family N-acetyltransferase [Oribacterium sp.]